MDCEFYEVRSRIKERKSMYEYECERGHILFTAMPLRFVDKKWITLVK